MIEANIFSNPQDLFLSAAEDFSRRAQAAVLAKGVFTVALSGGNTPQSLFDTLVGTKAYQEKTPWNKIKFFFSDERYVPLNDSKSNYHMAFEHLFSKVPVLKKNIYPIPTHFKDPLEAAKDYERTLRNAFKLKEDAFPNFDLLYLGLGDDAHTASLMPLSDVVKQYCKISDNTNFQLVTSLWVAQQKMYRITFTPPAINHAEKIIFLVTGANKATAVNKVLEGPPDPEQYPAQLIHGGHHKTLWYLDEAAASQLSRSKYP